MERAGRLVGANGNAEGKESGLRVARCPQNLLLARARTITDSTYHRAQLSTEVATAIGSLHENTFRGCFDP